MSTKTYKAPIEGYYLCSSEMMQATPTGENKTAPNPDKKWWEFWKPKTIVVPVYKYETVHSGTKIVLLKQGEEVVSSIGIRRL